MDRFGSTKLRMVWAGFCVLLAGLVVTGIQGFSADGTQLQALGVGIPLGFEDPKSYVVANLSRLIYTAVPAVILLGGFLPLTEWLSAGNRGERLRGLFVGGTLAFCHGVFLAQLTLLPVFAASYRLLGTPFDAPLLLADLNALVLGLQLLLWAAALALVLRSNRGLALLAAYALTEVGRILAWGGEFLGDLEVPKLLVKLMALLGKALPTGQLPSDPLSWQALPLSLGVPLALTLVLLLLPGQGGKRSRA